MSIGVLADIIVALTAVGALILSIYNTLAQRHEKKRQQREREPHLSVEMDSRISPNKHVDIYSCRIVNDGYVPVEIRTLRIVLDDGRTFLMPELHEDLVPELWENEQPITKSAVPTVLQPGQSTRYATSKGRLETVVRNAGLSGGRLGFAEFSVAVVDALDNHYTAEDSFLVGYPEPEP